MERALAARPDELALVDQDGQWTFAQSFERSLRLAGGLRGLGVGWQQPAALLLDNSMDLVHLWSGLSLVGAVEVPVNTAYKGRFLSHVLNDSGVEVAVVEDRYCERLAAVAGDLDRLRTVVVRGGSGDALPAGRFRVVAFEELDVATPASPERVGPADLIGYMYTSGTTGLSKGVLVPHAQAYTYSSREDQDRLRSDDRILVALPLFHLAGQWFGVYQSLIHQARCVLETAFSASGFWDVVRHHGITVTIMLGAMAELLQQQPPRSDDADNPLELATMAPLASDVEGFRKRFGVEPAAVYGMSEIGCVLNGPPSTIVGGEAGFPRDGYDLRLVDENGHDVATGEIGELLVRPHEPHIVMAGYHNLPDKTAETVRDGWVHTGDAFRTDADGRFYFSDRMKDALRRRGENVSSFEVESVINEHPGVFESAVVAVPSEFTEDEIKAVVVLRDGHEGDPEALTRFLIDRLPYFMVPRYLEFAPELPKTPTQKVQKHLLRDSGVDRSVWDREAAGIRLRRGD
ncbi:MAG: AMP-binding protein [Pseudonocardiaceae bacterium]|nr:AMP-binding protein [Pseudonocardiaceae bacterium]